MKRGAALIVLLALLFPFSSAFACVEMEVASSHCHSEKAPEPKNEKTDCLFCQFDECFEKEEDAFYPPLAFHTLPASPLTGSRFGIPPMRVTATHPLTPKPPDKSIHWQAKYSVFLI